MADLPAAYCNRTSVAGTFEIPSVAGPFWKVLEGFTKYNAILLLVTLGFPLVAGRVAGKIAVLVFFR